jgi:D-arabinose 5-phosphate isomerase GutQ
MSFDSITSARSVLRLESEAIDRVATRLDGQFSRAVEMIGALTGTLITSGVGKSGHVARKVAATFSSIGTPAIFLHATESGSRGHRSVPPRGRRPSDIEERSHSRVVRISFAFAR